MNTRLQRFISAENITQAQFADSINVARASVSHILAGRNKPGFDFISSMAKRYPSLNVDWLITGKGRMYKDQPDPVQENTSDSPAIQPQAAAKARVNMDGDDLLFHDDEIAAGVQFEESRKAYTSLSGTNARESVENAPNPTFSAKDVHTAVTAAMASSTAQKQRKAVKVVIFYDDNTFQEF